jgi:hypothetical protein
VAHDPQGAAGAPLLLTQDGLGGDCRADAADKDALTATALFCLPPVAQGSKRRSSITANHTAIDGARTSIASNLSNAPTGTAGNANEALTSTADNANNAITGTVHDAIFRSPATGASDDGTNNAPPSLTQGETVDRGNEREERGDPGPIARGEGGTVRARDIEGEDDLGHQVLHPCHNQLVLVYGDSIHCNDGRHLDGGVADNSVWLRRYDRVVAHPHTMYNPPKGGLDQWVLSTMGREFGGVHERRWNSERTLVFAACVLRKSPGVIRARDIKRRVERRLQLWTDGHYNALVQDIVGEAMKGAGSGRGTADEDIIARKYNLIVLDGKLRAAVRFATNHGGGGVLLPQDSCTKTGRPVMEVLRSQHPDTRIPNLGDPHCIAFEHYDEVPVEIPTDCTSKDLKTLALRMSGNVGPSSFDAVMLRNCLLRYGRASGKLRQELAAWVEWLSNESPPWAAYRALMSRRLVALDKQPGVWPVAIGEIWQRCIAKGILVGSGAEAKGTCGSVQLCAGLEAGIEGALHAVRLRAKTNKLMQF